MILFKKFGMKQVQCSEGSASPRHLRSQFNSGEKLKKKRKKTMKFCIMVSLLRTDSMSSQLFMTL